MDFCSVARLVFGYGRSVSRNESEISLDLASEMSSYLLGAKCKETTKRKKMVGW